MKTVLVSSLTCIVDISSSADNHQLTFADHHEFRAKMNINVLILTFVGFFVTVECMKGTNHCIL